MKKRKIVRLSAGILACLILLCSLLFVWKKPDLLFRAYLAMKPAKEAELSEVTLSGTTVFLESLLADARITQNDSGMLVNRSHPLPSDYSPSLSERRGSSINSAALDAFDALCCEIKEKTGRELLINSAYRTAEEQAELYASSKPGVAAEPDKSEHLTGLALDVAVKGFGGMSFLKTKAGQMTSENAWKYGFIIRYPDGKMGVTGYSYEPWHLRYVGAPHAEIISASKLTLEEYFDLLTPNVWYAHGGYLILRISGDSLTLPASFSSGVLSPDNAGGYLLTLWSEETE